jgi:WD40 repeat protein
MRPMENSSSTSLRTATATRCSALRSAPGPTRGCGWDYEAGEQLTKINRGGGQVTTIMLDHDKQVSRVQFIGNSSQVITCSGDQGARLWNVELQTRPGNYTTEYYAGRMLRTFGAGTDYLYAAAASPDGALIVTGGESGAVNLYSASDAKLLHTLAAPTR